MVLIKIQIWPCHPAQLPTLLWLLGALRRTFMAQLIRLCLGACWPLNHSFMFSNHSFLYYNYTKPKRGKGFVYKCSSLPVLFPLVSRLILHYLLDFSSQVPFFRKPSLVPLDRSEGSSGLPLLCGLSSSPSHCAWTFSHPGPNHSGLTLSGNGFIPSHSGPVAPEEPLVFWCVPGIAQVRNRHRGDPQW